MRRWHLKWDHKTEALIGRFEATNTQGKGTVKRKDLHGMSKELKGTSQHRMKQRCKQRPDTSASVKARDAVHPVQC